MKKVLIVMLILILTLSAVSCTNSQIPEPEDEANVVTEESVVSRLEKVESELEALKASVADQNDVSDANANANANDGAVVDVDHEAWLYRIDPETVKGEWQVVGFVDRPNQFNPLYEKRDFYLKSLDFSDETVAITSEAGLFETEWMDNVLLHYGDRTASRFLVKEIDGTEYMFYEWKSGDYTIRGEKPSYYVFKKS